MHWSVVKLLPILQELNRYIRIVKMLILRYLKVCCLSHRSHCFSVNGISMPALSNGFFSSSKPNVSNTKKMMTHQTMLVHLQKSGSSFFKRFRSHYQSQNLLHQQRMGAESISTSVETISNIGTKMIYILKYRKYIYVCLFILIIYILYLIIYIIVVYVFTVWSKQNMHMYILCF